VTHDQLAKGSRRMLSSVAASAAFVFAASVQLDYQPAGISGLRSATADGGRWR
jgi:hypothetical protein